MFLKHKWGRKRLYKFGDNAKMYILWLNIATRYTFQTSSRGHFAGGSSWYSPHARSKSICTYVIEAVTTPPPSNIRQVMVSAKKASLQALKEWVTRSKARKVQITRGVGVPGHRAAPTQAGNNDAKIGSRLDAGEIIRKGDKEYRRYKWQINKDAENTTLRKMTAKHSHKVWSYADVEIKEEATDEEADDAVADLFGQLEENMEEED